jgi:hypothetical protein
MRGWGRVTPRPHDAATLRATDVYGAPDYGMPRVRFLVPLSSREASEEDEPDQGDDQPDPPVPEEECEDDPDDDENAAEANPTKSRICSSISHASSFRRRPVALRGLCRS